MDQQTLIRQLQQFQQLQQLQGKGGKEEKKESFLDKENEAYYHVAISLAACTVISLVHNLFVNRG